MQSGHMLPHRFSLGGPLPFPQHPQSVPLNYQYDGGLFQSIIRVAQEHLGQLDVFHKHE